MQSQIADKTKPHSGTRRKCLADLEDAGWIESKKSPQHWSAICYFVTAEGERVCKLLLQIRDGDEHRTNVIHGTHQEDVSVTERK